MKKDNLVYIHHILDAIESIERYTAEKEEVDFASDEMLQDAVTHQVQIIGEAARHVSSDFQKKYSTIPWRKIIGMRHKLVHDYLEVDVEALWLVVERDLPELKKQLQPLLADN